MKKKKEITVIGAGIQGCCIALELANRGFLVKLLDQDTIPFNRSSIRNEGKIHLGMVYVNDPDFETPKLMIRAALRFAPYLTRWIGSAVSDLNIGTPFYYLVSKDSFLTTEQLEHRYQQLENFYLENRKESLKYLGSTPDWLVQRCSEDQLEEHFNTDLIMGGFRTCELSIDTYKLANHIRKAVNDHTNISFSGGRSVQAIVKKSDGFLLEGTYENSSWSFKSLQVVNATWTSKYQLDESMGIKPPKEILHRLKYRVIADIPAEMKHLPSATMVIGKFGDVVIRPNNTAYISWYPEACRGWSNSILPPDSWTNPSRGDVSERDFKDISEKFILETAKWYPAISRCTPKIVDAGIIVAQGQTDVDDKNSRLHKRSKIGVTSYEGYHSVETGKLTTAPMFAMDTADNVETIFQKL